MTVGWYIILMFRLVVVFVDSVLNWPYTANSRSTQPSFLAGMGTE